MYIPAAIQQQSRPQQQPQRQSPQRRQEQEQMKPVWTRKTEMAQYSILHIIHYGPENSERYYL